MKMKRIYYIAVAKPNESKVWLPMMKNQIPILGLTRKRTVEKGMAALSENIGECNKFQRPQEWKVKAASVMI